MSTRREFLEQAAACLVPVVGGKENEMQDTDQMLMNEVNRLERAIGQRQKQVDHLAKAIKEKSTTRLDRRPRRYSMEFEFDAQLQVVPPVTEHFVPESQTRSFVVDGGSTFYCSQVETSLRAVGQSRILQPNPTPPIPGQVAQLTIPYGFNFGANTDLYFRQGIFDFTWRIFDTGSDREWQNTDMASVFLLSGTLSGMQLPTRARMVGGSEVSAEVQPISFASGDRPANTSELFDRIDRLILHLSFEGHEVRS